MCTCMSVLTHSQTYRSFFKFYLYFVCLFVYYLFVCVCLLMCAMVHMQRSQHNLGKCPAIWGLVIQPRPLCFQSKHLTDIVSLLFGPCLHLLSKNFYRQFLCHVVGVQSSRGQRHPKSHSSLVAQPRSVQGVGAWLRSDQRLRGHLNSSSYPVEYGVSHEQSTI